MTVTKEELLQRIKKDILAVEPTAEIIMFGSRARGDAREDSDWDLFIIVDGKVDLERKHKLNSKLFQVDLDYEVTISPFLKSKIDWETPFYQASPLWYNVSEEGIYL
jgi:uncharacterized protein